MNASGYPQFFDEVDTPINCYNCDNDCMGILDIIFREGESHE